MTEAMDTNWSKRKENLFLCEGGQTLEQVAMRGCGIFSLGDIKRPNCTQPWATCSKWPCSDYGLGPATSSSASSPSGVVSQPLEQWQGSLVCHCQFPCLVQKRPVLSGERPAVTSSLSTFSAFLTLFPQPNATKQWKLKSPWKAPPVPAEEQRSKGEMGQAVTTPAPCCTAEVLSLVSLPQTGMRIACCCTILWQSKIQPLSSIPYCSSQSSDLA